MLFRSLLKMFFRNKHEFEKGKPVNQWYTTTIFSIVGFFMLLILVIVVKQAIKPASIKTFIESLGSVEAIFGIYIESIISDFLHQAEPNSTSEPVLD